MLDAARPHKSFRMPASRRPIRSVHDRRRGADGKMQIQGFPDA